MGLLRAAGAVSVASAMVASLVGAVVVPPAQPIEEATSSFIIELAPGQTPSDVEAELTDELGTEVELEVGRTFDTAIDGFTTELTPSEAAALKVSPDVLKVYPNIEYSVDATQNSAPWNLSSIDQTTVPADSTYTYPDSAGAGTRIYIVDTGISPNATEFGSRLLPGVTTFNDGNGTADCNGHGTHVAGTAASATYGIAKQANLVPVRVFGCNQSTTSDIVADGLDWIIANHPAGTPGIVNLSLGSTEPVSPSEDDLLTDYVNYMSYIGFVMVVAGGNSGADACNYSPSRADYALTVGATGRTDARPSFSNFGPCLDLFAPGVEIRSLEYDNSPLPYSEKQGTSMASPHVAGAAALYWGADPTAPGWSIESSVLSNTLRNVVSSAGSGSPNALLNLQEASLPARLADTRVGESTVDGFDAGVGAIGPGQTLQVQVLGRANIPTSGVGAVTLNVTATSPTAFSYLTVFPTGQSRPLTSNLNFTPGQSIPNTVIAEVGADGTISIFNNAGNTHVIVDISGWFPDTGVFNSVGPARLADTRPGEQTIDDIVEGVGAIGPGQTLVIPIRGRAGIPDNSTVRAVTLNVTATSPTAFSYLTVFPTGQSRPLTSNLNFTPGQSIPNTVIAQVGADGSISVYNHAGSTQVIVDVSGWFPDTGVFTAVPPARLADTRAGQVTIDGQSAGVGSIGPGQTLRIQVLGRAGVPNDGSVGAVTLNVTATSPTAFSYLTVFPTGRPRPLASNLNFTPGQSIPNTVIAPVGADGSISVFNNAGNTHVIVDISGWLAD